uniref:Superoxide dismutase n=1 Tax=Syphacia muris TaxID=451379 RepID=A0A0N5AN40_9BILA
MLQSLIGNKFVFRAAFLTSVLNKHTLPDLPYDYGDLEPVMSASLLQVHHKKHHFTYVNNLNQAEEQMCEALAKGDVKAITKLADAIKFNGGGHLNHSLFWTGFTKEAGEPSGELLEAIKADFGSTDRMKEMLSNMTIGVQGSGWGWLGYNKGTKRMELAVTANQDSLEATTVPLFCIDVWEHAYYLQYKNVRPDFVKAIWKIVNWQKIEERYKNAKHGL